MEMTYRAHRKDPDQVQEMILEIWRANRKKTIGLRDIYRWYYEDNPAGRGSCFVLEKTEPHGLPICAGSTGAGLRQFFLEGKPVQSVLFGDFFVHRAHRSLFPALTLQRTAQEWALGQSQFVYGFPNRMAVGVFQRLGFSELGKMTRYVRVLRHEPYLRKMISLPSLIVAPACAVLDRGVPLFYPGNWHALPIKLTVSRLDEFGGSFDQLAKVAHSGYPIVGCREGAYLRWRFAQKPDEPCEIYGLSERAAGVDGLRAYAVVHGDGSMAIVRDLFGRRLEDVELLLPRLCRQLRKRGFQSVSFSFLGSRAMVDCLTRNGFQPRESERVVICKRGANCAQDDAFFQDRNNWYLTDADEDQ